MCLRRSLSDSPATPSGSESSGRSSRAPGGSRGHRVVRWCRVPPPISPTGSRALRSRRLMQAKTRSTRTWMSATLRTAATRSTPAQKMEDCRTEASNASAFECTRRLDMLVATACHPTGCASGSGHEIGEIVVTETSQLITWPRGSVIGAPAYTGLGSVARCLRTRARTSPRRSARGGSSLVPTFFDTCGHMDWVVEPAPPPAPNTSRDGPSAGRSDDQPHRDGRRLRDRPCRSRCAHPLDLALRHRPLQVAHRPPRVQ